MSLLIKNAIIVSEQEISVKSQDILIEHNKIVKIASTISTRADQTVDAKNKYVLPGLIDLHVHLRTPGQEHKETIETGCRCAAKGGFTSVFCMPNTNPVIDTPSVVEMITKEASRVGLVNVYPIGAISKGQKCEELTEMAELKNAGCVAFSDDGKGVHNSQLMRLALEYSKMLGLLLIQHCEDPCLSNHGVMNEGYRSTVLGLKGWPEIAETVMIARDIELGRYLNARVHFAHISCKRSVELVRWAKAQGIPVTAEACPHHFTLTDEDVKNYDTNFKVNPPLRTAADVQAIKEGLKDGTVDCITTDHAPHALEEKELGFDQAPFGMIGLETALGLAVSELIEKKVLTWPQLVDRMCVAPARVGGLANKGIIKEGTDADVTIIDPHREWTFEKKDIASKSKNSPFLGRRLKGLVETTICGGRISYQIGK